MIIPCATSRAAVEPHLGGPGPAQRPHEQFGGVTGHRDHWCLGLGRHPHRLLAGTGLAGAVVMTFDKVRAGTTAQDFIHHDLIERLGISGIAVGYDFHFGKGRAGNNRTLAELVAYTNPTGAAATIDREPEAVSVQLVSGRFFPGLGVAPAAGRLLGPAAGPVRKGSIIVRRKSRRGYPRCLSNNAASKPPPKPAR